MQIEIDIEKLVTRGIVDGLTNSERLQDEILEDDECREILVRHVRSRIDEILSSEEGKKRIDKVIIDTIIESDQFQDKIRDALEEGEYDIMLANNIKESFNNILSSQEGREDLIDKIKGYLTDYDITEDSDLVDELNKEFSGILLSAIKDPFERFKRNDR